MDRPERQAGVGGLGYRNSPGSSKIDSHVTMIMDILLYRNLSLLSVPRTVALRAEQHSQTMLPTNDSFRFPFHIFLYDISRISVGWAR